MPSLGSDMEAGTLIEWLVKPGDTVARGDVVAVVDTQKGAIDVEIFEDGVVETILVGPDKKVPVGTVLAIIRGGAELTEPPAAPAPEEAPPEKVPGVSPAVIAAGSVAPRPQGTRVSPAARKRAAELGVDLTTVNGTGPASAVTLNDVERAAGAPPKAAPGSPAGAQRHGAMRQAIADAMARSKREIPHYYLGTTIDMGRTLDWLKAANERRPVTRRLLPAVLLLKVVALALLEVPELNGFWRDGAFNASDRVHVGTAISLRGGGLVAPAVHDADCKTLDHLMDALRDVVQRARAGSLRSSELSEASVTVTSLGEQGVDTVYGVIYPPQVALIGFGRVADRPWVVDGAVRVRPLLQATLAADHRASDGHRGGLFLAAVERLLQEPEKL